MVNTFYEAYGAVKSAKDSRDYKIVPKQEFPETFTNYTALKKYVPARNQGQQSTCVPHAAAALVEFHHRRQKNKTDRFSTEFIYGLREFGYFIGDGMSIRDALKTLKKYGVPFETDCPGNNPVAIAMQTVSDNEYLFKELASPHRISAYMRLNSDAEMKTALMEYGPILVSMTTYKNVNLVSDKKVYTLTGDSKKSGRHCVMIYGWDQDGWLAQNSWGSVWGKNGRFVIPYSMKLNEAWGVADDIINDDLIKPTNNKFITFINKAWCIIAGNVTAWANKISDFFTKLFKNGE